MRIAYSYIRMSTGRQIKGDSLRRQLEAARTWAEAKGYRLDDGLRDIGVSAHRGRNKTKGALAGFFRAVEDGTVEAGSILLIENVDRLSREKPLAALDTLRALLQAGIVVVPLDLGWELDEEVLNREPWRLQALLSMMERAHNESATKSHRGLQVMETKRRRAVDGIPFSTIGPGWLDNNGDGWIVVEAKAAIIREMFELAASGVGSYRIAIEFTRKGYPTFGGAKHWGSSYVSKTLRNEAVVGTWQPHREDENGRVLKMGEPILNHFPDIISKDLFLRVQRQILPKNSRGAKGRHFKNLFTGRCRCAACGDPIQAPPPQPHGFRAAPHAGFPGRGGIHRPHGRGHGAQL
ncbi:recombinase family protein [Methylobacterium radiodurans]|uniref:recombinase family protein n=1 Tax=Methylobacterium radiodurans TaxID=2202828 RepID=UPI0013A53536|nr:recombinase family protein [Methylobacterium radiodurans]